jgi:hypothetical protein
VGRSAPARLVGVSRVLVGDLELLRPLAATEVRVEAVDQWQLLVAVESSARVACLDILDHRRQPVRRQL